MVKQILNTPHDLDFAGKWLSNQFNLSPRKRKDKVRVKELEKELKELKTKGGGKTDPLIKKQLEQVQKELNLILNKWKFGDAPITSANEFLNSFEPWINKQIKDKEELKEFLEEQGASNLTNLKETWKNTEADYLRRIEELREGGESSEEIAELEKDIQKKEKTIIGLNNSYDKLDKKYEELKKSKGTSLTEDQKEKLAEYDDLITERDEAIREKKTLEQEALATNNRLNLKQQEVSNKDKALEKLKKEKNQLELNQQKVLKEKNGLITTLQQEIKQHKEKYSKQGKLLDTEQLESKRLEEENEKLKEEIKKIKEKNWK